MLQKQRVARAKLGVAARRAKATGQPEDLATRDQLDTEYRTLALSEYVRKIVDQAPPLSDAQRAKISAVLMLSAGGPNA